MVNDQSTGPLYSSLSGTLLVLQWYMGCLRAEEETGLVATCLDAQEGGVDEEVAALIEDCIGGEWGVSSLELPLLGHPAPKVDGLQLEHVCIAPL